MASAGTKFGKYVLLRRIATGGMAEIYLARHDGMAGFARQVVIKRIHTHLNNDPEFISMFLDEARLVARMSHPNIVSVHDFGVVDGAHYLAMEYVHGVPLSTAIKRSGGLDPAHAVRVTSEVCSGLHYAHSLKDSDGKGLNVVHRDVSPQNVLLSYDGGVKLIDFGVAKATTQAHQTRAGAFKGKYSYMSPEQAAGKPIDHRSDVHSVGIVLWESLTGRGLYHRNSLFDTIEAVMNLKPPPVRLKLRDLHAGIDDILAKGMAKDVRQRYQSCGEMQLALDDYAVEAGLHSSSLRLGRYVRSLFHIESTTGEVRTSDIRDSTQVSQLSTETASSAGVESGSSAYELPAADIDMEPMADGGGDGPSSAAQGLDKAATAPQDSVPPGSQSPLAGGGGQGGYGVAAPARQAPSMAVAPEDGGRHSPESSIEILLDDELSDGLSASQAGQESPPMARPGPALAARPPIPTSGEPRSRPGVVAMVVNPERPSRRDPSVATPIGPGPQGPRPTLEIVDHGPGSAYPAGAAHTPTPSPTAVHAEHDRKRTKKAPVGWIVAGILLLLIGAGVLVALGYGPLRLDTEPDPPTTPIHSTGPADSGAVAPTKIPEPVEPEPIATPTVDASPATPAKAFLEISSDPPEAGLIVDGEDTNRQTTVTDLELDPGHHLLELSLEGYDRWTKRIDLRPGERARLWASLTKARQQRTGPSRDPGTRRDPEPRRPQPPDPDPDPAPAQAEEYGTLSVNTTPRTRVMLGSRSLGATPLRHVELPAGRHTLTFILDDGRRLMRSVQINPGRPTRMHFDVLPTPAPRSSSDGQKGKQGSSPE